MRHEPLQRPRLAADLPAAEFDRWYWEKAELERFARTHVFRSTGSKNLLAARVRAFLGGEAFVEPVVGRPPAAAQLDGALTPATIIPIGQRCTQHLRRWFEGQVGGGFRFDSAMRTFFATTGGQQTLGDALNHWRATRGQNTEQIAAQFEYNRFTRNWRTTHPNADRQALLQAWWDYRNQPIDERGRL